jgi:hypothetical protein
MESTFMTHTIETSPRRWAQLELEAALTYYRAFPATQGAVRRLVAALDDYRRLGGVPDLRAA